MTKLTNLINPQVLADFVDPKLCDNIVFAAAAVIDNTLEGRPGDTLTFPTFSYIGAASVVAEGSTIPVESLYATSASVKVEKLAKKIDITDESVLSGAGDPVGEIGMQLVKCVDDAVDGKFLAVLGSIGATMTHTTANASTEVAVSDLNDALELFGEDVDGIKIAYVSPQLYTKIRKTSDWCPASEISADMLVKGAVGEIYGCQIVVTNRLKAASGTGNAYIVKPGALRLVLKRGSLIETDRDPGVKTSIVITKHSAAYLYDASKAIKITKGA